jgi:hypothetical protein
LKKISSKKKKTNNYEEKKEKKKKLLFVKKEQTKKEKEQIECDELIGKYSLKINKELKKNNSKEVIDCGKKSKVFIPKKKIS